MPAPLEKGSIEMALKLDAVKATVIIVIACSTMKVTNVSRPAQITPLCTRAIRMKMISAPWLSRRAPNRDTRRLLIRLPT